MFVRDTGVLNACIACVGALALLAGMCLRLDLSAVDSVLCVAMTVPEQNTRVCIASGKVTRRPRVLASMYEEIHSRQPVLDDTRQLTTFLS